MSLTEMTIEIPAEYEQVVFGQFDTFLKLIEKTLNVTVISRNGTVKAIGEQKNVEKAKRVLMQMV